ncbi:VOC family protein [Melghirimyces algeriensis]|uniref:Glyoxalase superfamily enzyme, possibly 3-demethylubiquinone-9 3-methyltransferase n=1 Tax=Melghirimyces algeriensis TaxID=910412 RepID=A0A521C095_9BACL|nr:VOC family protein [Melghirimyces algeriensis]SMO52814.1 Glyoxalase superfamily enzyme, possibly 3-demethylubiquinone-9 3-methyltransferase [Melghirimyces algeriensis]
MSEANSEMLQKSLINPITPHLWFDEEAKEAAEFYVSVFPDSTITSTTTLHNTPSGDCDVVSFTVCGHPFMGISAGPLFQFNPSISFIVNFDPYAKEKIDEVWNKLSEGGTALMPFDQYPFSERYGWIKDKYGVSWQLILTNPEEEPRPTIVPSLMFVGKNCGKAEEAREFYLSVFRNSKPGALFRYKPGQEPDKEGTVMFTDFMLENTWFAAMDSAREHAFNFNEAISLRVYCETQEEIDCYWEKLSAVPESEQCGWLKDKYGVSWQIVPATLDEMITKGTPEQRDHVTQAFLKMKKFNIAELKKAFKGD